MSKESALQFLKKLATDERAKELLSARGKPGSDEEKPRVYAEIAAELGEFITADDFDAAMNELEEKIRKKAEAAA